MTDGKRTSSPRVFVSYSWDSLEHKLWVESFARELREAGIDARLDAWLDEDQSIDDFMMIELERAEYVLAICTPIFKQKIIENAEGVKGTGSGIEAGTAAALRRVKGKPIIPVLRSGIWEEAAPNNLLGYVYYDFTKEDVVQQFEQLRDRLLGHKRSLPRLGRRAVPAAGPELPDIFSGKSASPRQVTSSILREDSPPDITLTPSATPDPSQRSKRIWDTFLSYNHKDFESVEKIFNELQKRNIKVFFDKAEIVNGDDRQIETGKALNASRTITICIGRHGISDTQFLEVSKIDDKRQLISIFLPGNTLENSGLPFEIRRRHTVEFAREDDPNSLYSLERAITGRPPSAPVEPSKPRAPERHFDSDESNALSSTVNSLSRKMMQGNVTFFLGTAVSQPPSAQEISKKLLKKIGILNPNASASEIGNQLDLREHEISKLAEYLDKTSSALLPPIDLAASYYAIVEDEDELEQQVVNLTCDRSPMPVHTNLAVLLKLLNQRSERRLRNRSKQLIITTNFDLKMELALLQNGISFTRLVQHSSGPSIHLQRFEVQSDDQTDSIIFKVDATDKNTWLQSSSEDIDTLVDWISNIAVRWKVLPKIEDTSRRSRQERESKIYFGMPSFAGLPGLLLYKIHGSEDIFGSCTISCDRYVNFLMGNAGREKIDSQITEVVANAPSLFFGYSFLDPEFRCIYHALLKTSDSFLEGDKKALRYAVHRVPSLDDAKAEQRLEATLWKKLKRFGLTMGSVEIIPSDDLEFLEALTRKVRHRLGGQ